jgi:hypothetical protein
MQFVLGSMNESLSEKINKAFDVKGLIGKGDS